MYINTLTLEYDLALRGLAQMALVTYIMLRSLITDTLVISSRKSPFHSELHFEKKQKEGKREGRVNKLGVPQSPQNSSFIQKNTPSPKVELI